MAASKTLLVGLTVGSDVLNVALAELVESRLDNRKTTVLTHGLGGDVGMAASTIPVTSQGLGVESDLHTEVLTDTVQEVASNGELVAHLDALAGTNLELPLGGHNLGVNTRDVDTSVETGAVVSLDNVTAVDLASTNTTVVRALGSRETTLGPAIDVAEVVEKSVLLLDTEPGLLSSVVLHDLGAGVAEVELVGSTVVVQALAENKHVVARTSGVLVDGNRLQQNVGVVARGLASGGTVEVPDGKVVNRLGVLRKSLALRAALEVGVDPDVLSKDAGALLELEVLFEGSSIRNRNKSFHFVCFLLGCVIKKKYL